MKILGLLQQKKFKLDSTLTSALHRTEIHAVISKGDYYTFLCIKASSISSKNKKK